MTDTVDDIVRDLQASVARELAAACDWLRAVSARPATKAEKPPIDFEIKDLMPVGDGAALARRAKPTMSAWCRSNPIHGDRGFAVLIGKRWFVSRSRLMRHLASGSSD
jgi:hypothetical protein